MQVTGACALKIKKKIGVSVGPLLGMKSILYGKDDRVSPGSVLYGIGLSLSPSVKCVSAFQARDRRFT